MVFLCVAGVKSAFTVSNPVAVTPHKVRFTHVITNIGGHYSNSTGVFTCQYSGLYVFDLHIMMIPGRDFAFCRIIKNGGGVLSALLRPDSKSINGYYGTSNSVVIHLVRGDIVGLGDCSSIHTDFDFDTTFLGFLIEAD